jgi:hypothetical protein
VSRSKGDQCLLDANPDYWGGRVDVDRVVFKSVPDPERRVDLLLRGAVDLIVPLAPEHRPRVASDPSTRVAGVLYAGLTAGALVGQDMPPRHAGRRAGSLPFSPRSAPRRFHADTSWERSGRRLFIVPSTILPPADQGRLSSLEATDEMAQLLVGLDPTIAQGLIHSQT